MRTQAVEPDKQYAEAAVGNGNANIEGSNGTITLMGSTPDRSTVGQRAAREEQAGETSCVTIVNTIRTLHITA